MFWIAKIHISEMDNIIFAFNFHGFDDQKCVGAQWLSGRALDLRPRGREFEPHRRHWVVSLSKNINPSLVLVQPRKTRPYITERLLMGRKESNQTKHNDQKCCFWHLKCCFDINQCVHDCCLPCICMIRLLILFTCACKIRLSVVKISMIRLIHLCMYASDYKSLLPLSVRVLQQI